MPLNLDKYLRAGRHKRILLRWLFKGLILAAVLWLAFILTGQALRQIAITQIAEITNTNVKAESVDFNLNGSVSIEKLIIRPDRDQKYDDAILKAEKVYARFSIVSLFLLQPRLKEISLNDFVFNAQQDLDTGRWNLTELKIKAPKGGSGKMPVVHLKRGILQYSKASNEQVKVIAAVPLDVGFEPDEKTKDGYNFNITTDKRAGFGKSVLTGFWQPGRIAIAGSISSKDLPAFERAWTINVLAAELNYDRNNTYSVKLKIKDLLLKHSTTPDTSASVRPSFMGKSGPFTALQRFFNRYQPRGQVDIDLEASGNLDRLTESNLQGKVYCKDVSICDRKFTYAMEHLIGQIDLTEKSAVLNQLHGRHNDVRVTLNGWSKDFGPNWKYQIRITSDNMALDNDLYDALSTKQKKFWSAFSPTGLAAIDYRRSRQSKTDKKGTLTVELLDAEAVYRRFPYPLKNLTGKLFFDHDTITICDVTSEVNERKIILNGQVTSRNTDRPIYDISVKADNIPLDSTLAEALPNKQRHLYNQLDMAGLADANVKIFTPTQNKEPATFIADVSFKKTSLRIPVLQEDHKMATQKERKNGALKINKSPLLVSDISAKAVFGPDLIRIKNLNGRYGQALVSLTGQIWPAGEAEQTGYCLSLQAEKVELNDDLIHLLPAAMKSILSKSQPEGKINLSANLNRAARDNCPDYKLTVDCLGNSVNFERFCYPLKDITGSLTITKNSITLADITAAPADNVRITPDTPAIKVNGQISLVDNAFSAASFRLSANDIPFDEQLGIALPESIRPFYLKLSPTGRFDLNFGKIKISTAKDGEKYINFTGDVNLTNCNFNTSPDITELDALLKTKGLYKTGEGFCNGQAALFANALRIKGKSLTELNANINYDPHRQIWSTKNLIAHSYDGKLAGRFEFKLPINSDFEYLLQVGFDNIDLKQFLSDTKPGATSHNGHTSGKMNGSLSISTAVGDDYSQIGRCRLKIADMQVGTVSPLAKLLLVLKLTEPTNFAFEQMLVDSYIKNDKLFFEKLDLAGEALAFNGSGWMDLKNQNVDLTLTARGRRLATAEPSILQSLTDALGGAVVRVEVKGNVYDPQVTTRTLPLFEDSLQILGTKPTEPD